MWSHGRRKAKLVSRRIRKLLQYHDVSNVLTLVTRSVRRDELISLEIPGRRSRAIVPHVIKLQRYPRWPLLELLSRHPYRRAGACAGCSCGKPNATRAFEREKALRQARLRLEKSCRVTGAYSARGAVSCFRVAWRRRVLAVRSAGL